MITLYKQNAILLSPSFCAPPPQNKPPSFCHSHLHPLFPFPYSHLPQHLLKTQGLRGKCLFIEEVLPNFTLDGDKSVATRMKMMH